MLIQTSETFNELLYILVEDEKSLYTPARIDQFFVKSSFTIEDEVILLDQTRGTNPVVPDSAFLSALYRMKAMSRQA